MDLKSVTNKTNGLIVILLVLILVAIIGVLSLKMRSGNTNDSSLVDLESKVEAFLMNNPKVVVNALEKHYRQEKELERTRRRDSISSKKQDLHNNSPFIGNPNADIVLVEFFDYNCGYCKKALTTITELTDKNPDVKVVFKDFPILGPESLLLAQASLAAYEINPNKYFEAHKVLMSLGRSAKRNNIVSALSAIGYNDVELSKVMNSKKVNERLAANRRLAKELGIGGTPAFILNDRFIEGFVDYSRLNQMISEVQ